MKDMQYLQTWHLVTKYTRWCKWLRRPIQWLCGKLCGHEISQTEQGYGGGKYADCWCRWCNKHIQVPVDESPFACEWRDHFGDGNGMVEPSRIP